MRSSAATDSGADWPNRATRPRGGTRFGDRGAQPRPGIGVDDTERVGPDEPHPVFPDRRHQVPLLLDAVRARRRRTPALMTTSACTPAAALSATTSGTRSTGTTTITRSTGPGASLTFR